MDGAAAAAAGQHRRRSQSSARPNPSTVTTATTARLGDSLRGSPDEADEALECDPEVWRMFNQSFRRVQTVLDRNRALIQQVNENHQSKSADNMVKNVALIQEINQNISKVVSLYSDLSSDFSTAFHGREANGADPASKESSPESYSPASIFVRGC
ncbi:protein EARLY FLOWERING 4 isoform X1 [Syzygium oleosum]|uniref:protein EARLY FLOWERING 4 isoform X1 n=1 Tax=Syzygium oleosum TaxID=219896 RepID=UPI0011D1948F|nr:protein EARLY FLOWERING 4 isoform X1 [Syzygium oleosum]